MWQALVFLAGSSISVLFLYPTLRDTVACVPRATSVPSMLVGGAYSFTFVTLGTTYSGLGSVAACTMWSLVATFRAAEDASLRETVAGRLEDQFDEDIDVTPNGN